MLVRMPIRSGLCVAVLSSTLFAWGSQARASDASPTREERLSAQLDAMQGGARRDPSTVHRHDGFYLRVASGFGVYDERLTSAAAPEYDGSAKGRLRGMAALAELALGGSIGRGWVLGGGIYSADLIASTFRSNPGSALPPAELDTGLRSVTVIGPFLDWYARESGGFHLQFGLGLGTMTPQVFGDPATRQSEYAAIGGGLMLGVGYEWWVDDDISLGILSRTTAVLLRGHDDADVAWTHFGLTSPGLLVTLTYQ